MSDLHVVLPGGVDDPAAPSGGNHYDRRACGQLTALGWRLVEHTVDGGWPRPDATEVARLAATLDAVPDGSPTLLDGLVACAAPEVVVPASARLRLAVLVHLPLVDEAGDTELDARERETLRAAAAVIATSDGAARRLAALHGLDRVRVAAPGVDPAPLSPGTAAGSRLLCVAAVTPRKAQDVLVNALASLAELDWTCAFAGALDRDPAYAARVMTAAGPLGGRVTFTGPLAGAELDDRYAAADLLVLPSRAETYGMVVTEALARGVPVLATDVGGVPEALGWAPLDQAPHPPGRPPDQAPHPLGGTPPDQAPHPPSRAPDQAPQAPGWSPPARVPHALGSPAQARAREPLGGTPPGRAPHPLGRTPDQAPHALGGPAPGLATEPLGEGLAERLRPGMLVPPGDPVALADALRRWLTQPEVRVNLRAAAAARRSTLDGWDATARALAAALEAL